MKILTFDIEEWYLYNGGAVGGMYDQFGSIDRYLDLLLDLLDSKDFKSTFFCLGVIARKYPEVIKRIANRGHEIGCHSDKHTWLTQLSYKEVQVDTKKAIESIEDLIGSKVRSYRAPAFSITERNKWVLEILNANGIEFDASIFPTTRDFGGYPSFSYHTPVKISYNGINLKEFPIGTMNVFGKKFAYSGGGYFRLLPYKLVRRVLQQRDYGMVYLHIRDFDQEQKRYINLRYFKNFYGIKWTYNKMVQLFSDFDFVSINRADKMISWDEQPLVPL